MFADLVILNGTICTVDRLFSYCQAVAVRHHGPDEGLYRKGHKGN